MSITCGGYRRTISVLIIIIIIKIIVHDLTCSMTFFGVVKAGKILQLFVANKGIWNQATSCCYGPYAKRETQQGRWTLLKKSYL